MQSFNNSDNLFIGFRANVGATSNGNGNGIAKESDI